MAQAMKPTPQASCSRSDWSPTVRLDLVGFMALLWCKKKGPRSFGGRAGTGSVHTHALSRPPPLGKGGHGDRISVSGVATAHVNNYTAPWLGGQWPVLVRKGMVRMFRCRNRSVVMGRVIGVAVRLVAECAFHHRNPGPA